jgi:sugar phosphate isomerase/epimerase
MNHVQFASSPWGFREIPLKDHCQWLKDHGFRYICGQFAPFKGMLDLAISDEDIARTMNVVKSFGLGYASFNANGDFMVETGIEDQIEESCRSIDVAAKFHPTVLIVFVGWQPRSDPAVYTQVSSALKKVARHAAKYNLPVALENHGGLTATAEQINRILDAVDEPNIGNNYDPANFLMHGADPLDALKKLKHPLFFTHFKSVKHVNGKKVYCRLSEGEIDYVPILEILKKTYKGIYAIEYEEPSDVFAGSEDDYRTLKKLLQKAGHHV